MENKGNCKKAWWVDPMQIFSEISAWIAFPAIIGAYIGKWLDEKYQTYPYLSIASLLLGFLFSSYSIIKSVKKYAKKIKKEEEKQKSEKKP